jgi:hypothetical protein
MPLPSSTVSWHEKFWGVLVSAESVSRISLIKEWNGKALRIWVFHNGKFRWKYLATITLIFQIWNWNSSLSWNCLLTLNDWFNSFSVLIIIQLPNFLNHPIYFVASCFAHFQCRPQYKKYDIANIGGSKPCRDIGIDISYRCSLGCPILYF